MSLENINLGEILSSIRIYKNIEVEELAKDICTVDEMILFEKGKQYPTLEVLAKIAEKLNVDLSYFFTFSATGSFNYVVGVLDLIKKYKRDRNYNAIYEIVKREQNNPEFMHQSNKQFLLWHEGICIYYLYGDKDKAYELLKTAIELTNLNNNNFTEREIEILTSLAIIEKDNANYERATKLCLEAYESLNKLPHLIDFTLRLRVLYALSQLLTRKGELEESLKYSLEGIKYCINNESLYLLGELYYQSGENYLRSGCTEKGRKYINNAITVFELQENNTYVQLVKSEIEKISNNGNI
ncbi:hypothetical protein WMO40_10015 [Bacillaceae bacterium CLA-AA-H227]|uniref:Uncharacterized protein n=1 Tax=Robertmurraya yapensis (ex Hitch et al 2024) TaxID=3133160 RepID=A0ACC6SAG5_9BACI